jgi:iron complex transport system ATP-binding protein
MRFCDKAILLHNGDIVAAGNVWDVVTPANVKKVYGMDIAIEDIHGRPRVIVL